MLGARPVAPGRKESALLAVSDSGRSALRLHGDALGWWRGSRSDDRVAQDADAGDLDADDVAGLEVEGRGAAVADA
jgi:hypothetical protein